MGTTRENRKKWRADVEKLSSELTSDERVQEQRDVIDMWMANQRVASAVVSDAWELRSTRPELASAAVTEYRRYLWQQRVLFEKLQLLQDSSINISTETLHAMDILTESLVELIAQLPRDGGDVRDLELAKSVVYDIEQQFRNYANSISSSKRALEQFDASEDNEEEWQILTDESLRAPSSEVQ